MAVLGDLISGALNMLSDARPGIAQSVQMLQQDQEKKERQAYQNQMLKLMADEGARAQTRLDSETKAQRREQLSYMATNTNLQDKDIDKIRTDMKMDDMEYGVFMSFRQKALDAKKITDVDLQNKLFQNLKSQIELHTQYGLDSPDIPESVRQRSAKLEQERVDMVGLTKRATEAGIRASDASAFANTQQGKLYSAQATDLASKTVPPEKVEQIRNLNFAKQYVELVASIKDIQDKEESRLTPEQRKRLTEAQLRATEAAAAFEEARAVVTAQGIKDPTYLAKVDELELKAKEAALKYQDAITLVTGQQILPEDLLRRGQEAEVAGKEAGVGLTEAQIGAVTQETAQDSALFPTKKSLLEGQVEGVGLGNDATRQAMGQDSALFPEKLTGVRLANAGQGLQNQAITTQMSRDSITFPQDTTAKALQNIAQGLQNTATEQAISQSGTLFPLQLAKAGQDTALGGLNIQGTRDEQARANQLFPFQLAGAEQDTIGKNLQNEYTQSLTEGNRIENLSKIRGVGKELNDFGQVSSSWERLGLINQTFTQDVDGKLVQTGYELSPEGEAALRTQFPNLYNAVSPTLRKKEKERKNSSLYDLVGFKPGDRTNQQEPEPKKSESWFRPTLPMDILGETIKRIYGK